METNHILVVDDDAGLRELLHEYLTAQGFEVSTVQDGAEMTTHLASHIPDIVILDLMLPGEDGLSLVRRLRMQSDLPIIMLSARGEDVDRIVGLEVGADDYLAKPFNPRELLARIRALLRRHGKSQAVEEQSKLDEIRLGSFVLKQGSREFLKNGRGIPLTAGEFNILSVFFENPNRVLSRDNIMDKLKGYERDPFDRSIDVRVTRLRRKIEDDPSEPVHLRTVWGEGYLFAPSTSNA